MYHLCNPQGLQSLARGLHSLTFGDYIGPKKITEISSLSVNFWIENVLK